MSELIVAHTNLDAVYPGYINFTRNDDGTVSVHLRGDPSCQVEGPTATLTLSAADFAAVAAEAADVKRLVRLLTLCRDRIESQTNVGIISSDPENEDPQHEFQELLVDLNDALIAASNTGGA